MARSARILIELEGGEQYRAELDRMERAGESLGQTSSTVGRQVGEMGRQADEAGGDMRELGARSREAASDVDQLGRESRQASGGVRDVGDASDRSGRQMGGLGDVTSATRIGMLHLGRAVGGAVAAFGVLETGRYVYNTTASFESLHAALVTATGSSRAADGAFDWIQDFAKETPYSLQEVTTAFIRMQNLGLNPTSASLRSFGNTSSSMSKTLMDFVEAVADATTGEFERLKEFGIRARTEGDTIRFTFRGVTTEITNDAASISSYLEELGRVQFAGGMQRQMETLNGVSSNFNDSLETITNTIGTRLSPAFKAGTTEAGNFLDALNSVIEANGLLRTIPTLLDPSNPIGGVLSIQNRARQLRNEAAANDAAAALGPRPDKYVPSLQSNDRPLIYRNDPLMMRGAGADPTMENPDLSPSKKADTRIRQLREMIALENQKTELAKVNAQIESGALGTLLPQQAARLRQLAREADAQNASATASKTAASEADKAASKAKAEAEARAERFASEVDQRRQTLALIGQQTELERTNANISVGAYGQINAVQQERLRGLAAEIDAQTQRQKLLEDYADLEKTLAADTRSPVAEAQARRDEQIALLNRAEEQGLPSTQEYSVLRQQIDDAHLARLTTLAEQSKRSSDDVIDNLDSIRLAANNVGQSLEDTFVQAARTGKLSFADMASSIIQDLTRIATQQAITRPLGNLLTGGQGGTGGLLGQLGGALGGWLGGGGASAATGTSLADAGISGFGTGSGLTDTGFGLFGTGHAGAVVGVAATGATRVHPSVFSGAPKLHGGGLLGDEVPFIGRRGEGVFTQEQMANLAPANEAGGAPSVTINNYGASGQPEVETRRDANGGLVIDQYWPEINRRMKAEQQRDIAQNGPVTQSMQSAFPGLQRGGVQR